MGIAVEHDHDELEFLSWAEAASIALERDGSTQNARAWVSLADAATRRLRDPPDMRAHVNALFGSSPSGLR